MTMLLGCFALGIAGAVWPQIAVVVLVGMLPTLAVLLADGSDDKAVAQTVGALNFAGVFPFLPAMWLSGRTGAPLGVLADTMALIAMYAAAALGWLLVAVLPPLTDALERTAIARRCTFLRQQQQRLVEEWGDEICAHPKAAAPAQPPGPARASGRPAAR